MQGVSSGDKQTMTSKQLGQLSKQPVAQNLPLVSIQEQESNHSKTLNKRSNEQTNKNSQSNEISLQSRSLKKSTRSHSLGLLKSNTGMLNESKKEEEN